MFAKNSISCIFSLLFVVVFMLAVSPLQVAHAAGVRYAKPAASGTGDCSSWANACTLQTALTGAASGDEIWAAAGTHKPTAGTDRTATFQLKDGVAVYGGFAGTETARTQRDPAANVTILSGDIDNDDSQTPIIRLPCWQYNNSITSSPAQPAQPWMASPSQRAMPMAFIPSLRRRDVQQFQQSDFDESHLQRQLGG